MQRRGTWIAVSIVLCAACNESRGTNTGSDAAPAPVDLGAPDLARADLASAPDLHVAPDLAGCAHGPGVGLDRWIVFDSMRGGNRDLYAVRADGCGLRRLTFEAS